VHAAARVWNGEKVRHVLRLDVATALLHVGGGSQFRPRLRNVALVNQVHEFVARALQQSELALGPGLDRGPGFDLRIIFVLGAGSRVVPMHIRAAPAQPHSVCERSVDVTLAGSRGVDDQSQLAVRAASVVRKSDEFY
jgi:hypothetical protein